MQSDSLYGCLRYVNFFRRKGNEKLNYLYKDVNKYNLLIDIF